MTEGTAAILLVEDDADLGLVLERYLTLHGFTVTLVRDGVSAISACRERAPDLILLDVMLPRQDGFAVAQAIRETSDVPIVFLTAREMKVDKLRGFAVGGDDYVVKPVDEEVLVARIRAVLRRGSITGVPAAGAGKQRIGGYRFLVAEGTLERDGERTVLTRREAELLALLAEREGELVPRREALQRIWGRADYFTRRSMDVYVSRLRRHLGGDPSVHLETIRGRGVVLRVGPD